MDIKRLRTFCKVYELRSFSSAGKALYLSQPTISAHVADLEKELGVVLFDRFGRETQPTAAGRLLYGYGQQLIRIMDEARAELFELKNEIRGDLLIGGSTIPAIYFLPSYLAKFFHLYKNVKITLLKGDSYEIINKVLQGEIDIGVVGSRGDESDYLEFIEIMKDELMIVGAAHCFPALQGAKELSELVNFPWVIREKGSGTRASFEQVVGQQFFEKHNVNIVAVVNDTESLLRAVLNGLGITVISRLAVADLLAKKALVSCTVTGFNFRRAFYLVHHRMRHLFPVVKRFLKFLQDQEVKANVANGH